MPADARRPRFVNGVLPVPHRDAGNNDAEPGVVVASDGTLWATSNSVDGQCGTRVPTPVLTVAVTYCGANVWRSRDAGRSWTWVANPFVALAGTAAQQVFGGGDADIAVAPEKNADGHYNVYATSLWGYNNAFAVSRDDGATWTLLPAETTPGFFARGVGTLPDRPWVSATGACTAHLGFNHAPGNVTVLESYDACGEVPVRTEVTLPFGPDSGDVGFLSKVSGRPVVDDAPASPYRNTIYYPAVQCLGSPCVNTMIVSVRRGGVGTWTTRPIAPLTEGTQIAVWPITVATDAGGRLYAAWHDGTDAWFASSKDAGTTWPRPTQLNRPGTTAVYPTLGGGAAGRVSVAWYGTDREGPSNDVETMGEPSTRGSAPWHVVVRDSVDGGRTFSRAAVASPVIHLGAVCLTGISCTVPNSRNLLDDFGVEVHPRTGRVVVVYTSDQPGGQDADIHTDYLADLVGPARVR